MLLIVLVIYRSIMALMSSLLLKPSDLPTKKDFSRNSCRHYPSGFPGMEDKQQEEDEGRYSKTNNIPTNKIVKSIYSKEHTLECRTKKKKLVQKCRHCIECRGIPAAYRHGPYDKLKCKVLDMMSSSTFEGNRGYLNQHLHQQKRGGSEQEVLIRVRTGPVPPSRWRLEQSLGARKSTLLEKRERRQLMSLNLPERYTNVSSMRVSAPSDMCMEKYSFAGTRAYLKDQLIQASEDLHVIEAKEKVCQHGRYLETVHRVSRGNEVTAMTRGKSTKSSPQSVLHAMDMSGSDTSSRASSGLYDPSAVSGLLAPAGAPSEKEKDHSNKKEGKKDQKVKSKKKGLDFISSFIHRLIRCDETRDQMCTSMMCHKTKAK